MSAFVNAALSEGRRLWQANLPRQTHRNHGKKNYNKKSAYLNIPGMYLHPLKGDRKGEWAMSVSGHWRVTFRFEGEDVIVVNLEDYH